MTGQRRPFWFITLGFLALGACYFQAARAQTARTYTAVRNGPTLTLTETETGLVLVITRNGTQFDFNGFVFSTEADARAFLETYADGAITRHGLSATNRAK